MYNNDDDHAMHNNDDHDHATTTIGFNAFCITMARGATAAIHMAYMTS